MRRRLLLVIPLPLLLLSCGVHRLAFSPNKKYTLSQVERDYSLYRNILKEHHPSLYWYTSRDSMDYYFNIGKERLKDSMTESEFRKVLNYVTAKINCGHTTIRSSKAWEKYSDTAKLGKMFPLSMKIWDDTMVVTANLNRKDSVLKRGIVITSINGRTIHELTDTLFNYISTDGYNRTHKYQTLSNRGFFGSLYTSLFGVSEKYSINYISSDGENKIINIPAYNPQSDTLSRTAIRPISNVPQPSRRERKHEQLNSVRLLKIDSVNHTAMMNLSSFGRGYGLRTFFKNSFKTLKKLSINDLIIDVRINGGGNVNNSTLLTRYITDHRFKICDSLYAIKKSSGYEHYIQNHFWNKLFMTFLSKKRSDHFYHFGYFERHYFKPKTANHYEGKVYILTGGNAFSATTLFLSSVIKQENVLVIGEETGGGSYGNSAWLIPDVKLPETGIRFRLPLFRMVVDKNYPKTGKGVQPEVESKPTIDAVRRGADFKLDKALELIKLGKEKNN